jgi:hypothetical protein
MEKEEREKLLDRGRRRLEKFQSKLKDEQESSVALASSPVSILQQLSHDKALVDEELSITKNQMNDIQKINQQLRQDLETSVKEGESVSAQLVQVKTLLNDTLERNESLIQTAQKSAKTIEALERDKVELLALLRQKESAHVLEAVKQSRIQKFDLSSLDSIDSKSSVLAIENISSSQLSKENEILKHSLSELKNKYESKLSDYMQQKNQIESLLKWEQEAKRTENALRQALSQQDELKAALLSKDEQIKSLKEAPLAVKQGILKEIIL